MARLCSILAFVCVAAGCSAPRAGSISQALGGGAGTLWIDLTGDSVTASGSDDAPADQSSLGAASVPAFDATIVAPQVDAATVAQVLVDRVRGFYLAYDLSITTTRPTSGDYAAVLVGGTSAILSSQPANIAGVGPVDCNDTNADSVGFAFSDSATPDNGGVVALGATIAHEAGHGFGLEHTTDLHDPMYSVAQPQQTVDDLFTLAFGSGDYSSFIAGVGSGNPEICGRADPLDNPTILGAVLPASTTQLDPAPTVSITFPPGHDTLPPKLPIDIDASNAARVEIYRDFELVAVLTSAPYTTVLDLPTATSTVLSVEAVTADAQRSRASLTFAVDSTVAPACNAQLACPSDTTCVDGFCAVVASDLAVPADAALPTHTKSGGCAMSGTTAMTPWWLWLVLLSITASWAGWCRRSASASRSS